MRKDNLAIFVIPIIVITLVCSSCYFTDRYDNSVIDLTHHRASIIPMDHSGPQTNLHSLLDQVTFIPLQTNDSSLIGTVDKVIYYDHRYYILDKSYSALKIFSEEGNYLGAVGGLGSGHGKFTELEDFIIDSSKNKIYLLSNDQRMTITYDILGNYMGFKLNSLFASNFGDLAGRRYYFLNNNFNSYSENYDLIVTDSSGNIVNHLFETPEQMHMSFGFTGALSTNSEGFLYSNPFSDTIFQITPQVIYPKYILSFGAKKLPQELKASVNELNKKGKKYAFLGSKIKESGQWLSFSFQDEGRFKFGLFNKANNELTFVNDSGQDILAHILEPPIGLQSNSSFISSVRPRYILDLLKSSDSNAVYLSSNYPALAKLVPQIKESDNPILVVFQPKSKL